MEKVYRDLLMVTYIKEAMKVGNLQVMVNIFGAMEAISKELSKMD